MAANAFRPRKYEDHLIIDGDNRVVGHIRVKPGSIHWSPKNSKDWHSVSLADFAVFMEKSGTKKKK